MKKKNRKLVRLLVYIAYTIAAMALILVANVRFGFIDEDFLAQYAPMLVPDYPEKSILFTTELFVRSAANESQNLAEKLNIRVLYEGLENVPKDGAFVAIANEYSILDGPFLVYGIEIAQQKTGAKLFRIQQYDGDNRDTYTLPLAKFGVYGNRLLPGGYSTIIRHLRSGNPLVIVPTGKYDVRFFDNASRYIRFHNGFLRFATDAEVGILPIYIKLDFPFWMKLLNSLLPRFCQALFHFMGPNILRNQTIRITFGKLIPYTQIETVNGRYPQKTLDAYEDKVRKLESNTMQSRFYLGFL